jgi:hypothetical protein
LESIREIRHPLLGSIREIRDPLLGSIREIRDCYGDQSVKSATRDESAMRWGSISATGLFILLTIFVTWPQAKVLGTHAYPHYDVYFNMWRLGWIAHALVASPSRLFDGNIFYPEPRALTFSDAVLVEGLLGAPLLILGLPRVLVHNLLLLGAIVSSATGTFVLARHLTRSPAAGIVAGIVFAFAPYRFDHYMHLELQWTTWMPWTFWALHRTLETGTWRHALLTGVFLSLQMLSSIYYGVFLGLLVGIMSVLLLVTPPRDRWRRSLARLTVAAAIAVGLCGAYALPYLATKQNVGGRGESEVIMFSARASNYLSPRRTTSSTDGTLRAAAGRSAASFPALSWPCWPSSACC